MDWQSAFLAVIGLTNLILGWPLRVVWDSIRGMRSNIEASAASEKIA